MLPQCNWGDDVDYMDYVDGVDFFTLCLEESLSFSLLFSVLKKQVLLIPVEDEFLHPGLTLGKAGFQEIDACG